MSRPASEAISRIERVADGQFGVFAGRQALAVGVTRRMLQHHSQDGCRWARILKDVYCIVLADQAWEQPHMAAQLCLPGNPPLSHRAAAAILGLDGVDQWVARPEFIVVRGRGHRQDRWLIHQRNQLPTDLIYTGPLRHTGPRQTFADLATIESKKLLEYRVESGLRLKLVTEDELWELAALPGLGDNGRLEFVLQQRGRGTPPTASYLETVAIRVIRTCKVMPTPVRQHAVMIGRRVIHLDLAWPEVRLYAEVDGRAFHDVDDVSFFRDRWRTRKMSALGWLPIPLTSRELLHHPRNTGRELDDIYIARAREVG